MRRRVFLSVLGTGFYNKCSYVDAQKQFKSAPTRFIQEATLEALGVEKWSEHDAVYIFTTEKARQENWDKTSQVRSRYGANEEPQEYIRLEQVLEEKHYAAKIEGVDIPDGLNTEEMWKVFEAMYNKLEDGDRLYLDITHGFRYLPMMILVLCQYASFMKKTSICSLTYGNFEAMDRQANEAPLMDLSALTMLQGLTMGAAEFEKFGKMGSISEMFMQSASNKAERKLFQTLRSEATAMDESLATCRGLELQNGSHAVDLQKTLQQLQTLGFSAPMGSLFSKMQSQLNGFGINGAQNLRAAIEWCIQYGMTQQGYTLCKETVITLLCEHFKDWDPFTNLEDEAIAKEVDGKKKKALIKNRGKRFRDFVSSTLGLSEDDASDESKWRYDLQEYKNLTRSLLKEKVVNDLRGSYSVLTSHRNQINHAGFLAPISGSILQKALEKNAKNCLDAVCPLFDAADLKKPKLLLNLSNHPYSVWEEKQREAAIIYGPCVDMDFPKVRPEMSSEELDKLIADYEQTILKYAADHIVTVHIMGEMTFCFRLISRLQAKGIQCIASCAERNVVEQGNERIKSVYNFTRFREYGA